MDENLTRSAPTPGMLGRAALMSSSLCLVLGLFAFGVVLPQMAAAFPNQPNAILLSQVAGSIAGLAFALASPLMGALIDRWGSRQILIISTAAFALFATAPLYLNDLDAIIVSRALTGVSLAGALIASLTAIGRLPEGIRAAMFGMQALVGGVLCVASYYLVGRLALLGWRVPFALNLLVLAPLPLMWKLPSHAWPLGAKAPASAGLLAGLPPGFLLVAGFMGMATLLGPVFSPFYLGALGVRDPTALALPLIASAAASIPAAAAYGIVQRRLNLRGASALALGLTGVGLLATGFSRDVGQLALGLAFTSLGLATYNPNLSASAVALAPASAGRAVGLASGVMYGAQSLLPFVVRGVILLAPPAAVFRSFGALALMIGCGYALKSRQPWRLRRVGAPGAGATPPGVPVDPAKSS